MSNGNTNPWERLFKLWAMVGKLLLDGKRDVEKVIAVLQKIVEESTSTLADRIATCQLSWFNQDILIWRREDEPYEPRGEVKLLDLGRDISTDDALVQIAKRGYDPATIEELCDYGTKNPDAQRENPIVALKSVFVNPAHGYRSSPYLYVHGARRRLSLDDHAYDWPAYYRFAVVRQGTGKSGSGR